MLDVFKYEKGYWYPHMKPRDVAIWERFIDEYPDRYHSCQYDVEVGDIPDFVKNAETEAERKQGALYQWKIDAIGYMPDRLEIIELKPDAGASTIGQIEAYRELYLRDYKPTLPVSLCIVTDREVTNMRMLCEKKGISLFVV